MSKIKIIIKNKYNRILLGIDTDALKT